MGVERAGRAYRSRVSSPGGDPPPAGSIRHAAVLALLAWVALAGFTLIRARSELQRGLDAVDRAKSQASAADVADGKPLPDLRVARSSFDTAHRQISGWFLAPAKLLPVAGRQWSSLEALSGAAAQVAGAGVDGVSEARDVLSSPERSGPARVDLARRVAQLASRTRARLSGVDLGPSEALLGPLARARDQLSSDLARLDDGLSRTAAAAGAAAELLKGPHRYLLVAANNAEMRAGSGMFLEVGVLDTSAGSVRLGEMRSVTDVPVPDGVPIGDPDLAARWGWKIPNKEWRDLMLSPRFDASAALAARMWEAAGGKPVDGVISIDPVALSGLLGATGPVTVGGRTVREGDVVDELLHGQYLRYGDQVTARREELGGIARAVFDALDQGRFDTGDLARGLSEAASGRHLLAWSSTPAEQAGWKAAGIDGSIGPDSLLLAIDNRGGNKMDPFLKVRAELSIDSLGAGADATLRVEVTNSTPNGQPQYVEGPLSGTGLAAGDYPGLVVVNLPTFTARASIDGVDQLAIAGPDGSSLAVGDGFVLARGQTRSWTFRFRLARPHGRVRIEPSARVPATSWRYRSEEWSDTVSRTIDF